MVKSAKKSQKMYKVKFHISKWKPQRCGWIIVARNGKSMFPPVSLDYGWMYSRLRDSYEHSVRLIGSYDKVFVWC